MCSGETHISFLRERARDFPLDSLRWREIVVEPPITAVGPLIDTTKNFLFGVVIQKRKAECLFRIGVEIQLAVEVEGVVRGPQNVHFHRMLHDERCLPNTEF